MRTNALVLVIVSIMMLACSGADETTQSNISAGGQDDGSLVRGDGVEQDGLFLAADSIAGQYAIKCMGRTQKGEQCRRKVLGADYCWQHLDQDPDRGAEVSTPTSTPNRSIQTGPRGGQYYINKNGKKTYIKKK